MFLILFSRMAILLIGTDQEAALPATTHASITCSPASEIFMARIERSMFYNFRGQALFGTGELGTAVLIPGTNNSGIPHLASW